MTEDRQKLLDYFDGDELASDAWYGKYRDDGEVTPDDTHKRMAEKFSKAYHRGHFYRPDSHFHKTKHHLLSEYGQRREHLTDSSIYELFKDFKYIIPQGSVMSQLGVKGNLGSLSNCVVVDSPTDSYAGILKTDEELVQLMKNRCGVGFDISTLRPNNSKVNNSAKTSTGAVSFMERYSNTTREVSQNGRRGALMLTMDVRHPDIMEFIKVKRDLTKVTGANISIKLTDEFMKAVESNDKFCLRFPIDKTPIKKMDMGMNTIYAHDGGYVKWVNARDIWDEFVKSNHMSAEPGALFWDRVVDYSPDGVYKKYRQLSTNPCSEIAMQANDSCRLMLINLLSFVIDPYTSHASFDFGKFYEVAYEQQRLADILVDLEIERIDDILAKTLDDVGSNTVEYKTWSALRQAGLDGRRTGCGFTGLGDVIAMMGYTYGDDNSIGIADRISFIKMKAELNCSIDLSILTKPFKGWKARKESTDNPFYKMLSEVYPVEYARMQTHGRRNVSMSTLAPAGTMSLMAQSTSGIEPLFKSSYTRRKKVNVSTDDDVKFIDKMGDAWTEYRVVHKGVKDWGKVNPRSAFSLPSVSAYEDYIIENSPYANSTSDVIDWEKRIELQASVQKYTTHAISSTVNLPSDVTVEEVGDIYMTAWKQGLKGITIYRDGSRDGVLISNDEEKVEELSHVDSVKRPRVLDMELSHVTALGDSYTIIVGLLHDKPYEAFAIHGKIGVHKERGEITKIKSGEYNIRQGSTVTDDITVNSTSAEVALTRFVSMSLRHRVHVKYIVEQLEKSTDFIASFTKALSRTLKKYIVDGETLKGKCDNPDCVGDGTNIVYENGCKICKDCSSTAC